jgi:hypothetical protein
MISEIAIPEKEAQTIEPEQLQDLLETEFKTRYFTTTLDRIRLRSDGTVEFEDQQVRCTRGFLEPLVEAIGMSLSYAYSIDAELFIENFEHQKLSCSKAITVCVNRGTAVNFCHAGYRPPHTVDLLPGLADASFWKFNSARVSDRGVDINYIQPGCFVMPEKDDVIELGVRISNSETGYTGLLKGSLYSLRLVCTNGAVMADILGTARWNSDRRMSYATSLENFQKSLFKLQSKQDQQARLYLGLSQRIFLDREIVNVHRRLRTILPLTTVDNVLGLEPEQRQSLQESVRQRPAGVPAVATNLNVWDIHNRITAAAQRMDFSTRSRLERIGGALLSNASLN